MNAFGSAHNPHEDDTQAYDVELARRVAERVEEALDDPVMLADLAETSLGVRKAIAMFIMKVNDVTEHAGNQTYTGISRAFATPLRRDLARALTDRVAEEMMEEGKANG